jgi:ribosomal protein S8E
LDREGQKDAKALSTALKQKRKDKAAKYAVPLPKVRGIAEEEMFKVMRTGKSKSKAWKRMVTKATFVGEGFTRKPVKMERFVRPMALRFKRANVTHRECAVCCKGCVLTRAMNSGFESDVPTIDHRREEKSTIANVHTARRHD